MPYIIVRASDEDQYEQFLLGEVTWTRNKEDARKIEDREEAIRLAQEKRRRDSTGFFCYFPKLIK